MKRAPERFVRLGNGKEGYGGGGGNNVLCPYRDGKAGRIITVVGKPFKGNQQTIWVTIWQLDSF